MANHAKLHCALLICFAYENRAILALDAVIRRVGL